MHAHPADLRELHPARLRECIARLPEAPGVYRFRDARGRVLYLGRATGLRSRVRSYWSDLGGRRHLAAMVRAVAAIEAVPCDSVHEAGWLERNLLETALPRWNRTRGGQESPVRIRMDLSASAPGLSTLHEGEPAPPGPVFGPYLGGLQVRRAVAGLHRVLPLAYTGQRLVGSARDMARKLAPDDGADPAAWRAAIAARLGAVLAGEPAATRQVLDDLAAARDRAAAAQAYELAGRVQDEIRAVEWITSPQRVTVADGPDAQVYGYADGVLTHFEVAGGRLRRWRQRAGTERLARPLVAGTPADWQPFAARAARLAAQLRAG